MADKTSKVEKNVPGRWYVDTNCMGCGMCQGIAPANVAFEPGYEFAYISKQPDNPDEEAALAQAADQCPAEAIGNDG